MASHDILRTSRGPRSEEERRKERQQIEAYKVHDTEIRDAINSKDLSEQTLQLTSTILKGSSEHEGNPEYYTIWNHRRRVLLHLSDEDPSSIEHRLGKELEFQLPLLKRYPKCYWLWNHRMWLLTQASKQLKIEQSNEFWQQEFALDNMMLTRDNRNFHGWGYRRRVVKELRQYAIIKATAQTQFQDDTKLRDMTNEDPEEPEAQLFEGEYAYTKKMASSSLSNFSAWHQRSQLIPKILDLRHADSLQRRALFDFELEYIREAVLTDPWNQSLWFYHNYIMMALMDRGEDPALFTTGNANAQKRWVEFTNHDREEYLAREIREIREVLDDTDDCKWIYQSLVSLAESYLDVDGGNQGSVFTTKDLRTWLERLQAIDPLRSGRWNDWSAKLGLG